MKKVLLILVSALLCLSATAQDLTPKKNARGKWGYVDNKDNWLIKARYDIAEEFGPDGLAKVQKDDVWGFVNKAGREVVKP
ncbi:MAG: WG repeat-containing protein, partial [Rikenellaceae bacterium]|nr:WG repeat-containing protein [Rikenellaceae bacterium]